MKPPSLLFIRLGVKGVIFVLLYTKERRMTHTPGRGYLILLESKHENCTAISSVVINNIRNRPETAMSKIIICTYI